MPDTGTFDEAAMSRRDLIAAIACLAAAPTPSWAQGTAGRTVFYVAVGAELNCYAVDTQAPGLSRIGGTRMPEAVQYIWLHPSKPLMYVAFSNRYSTKLDNHHGVAVYEVDRRDGGLRAVGDPVILANRPVHVTVDPAGQHLLIACNLPAELWVYGLEADGRVGARIEQRAKVDAGVYAHQVRVAPSGRFVVLCTRGNDATARTREDPGAIKVFGFEDGQLMHEASVANGEANGIGFGPRHVDFHPTLPRMYVSMERNNELLTYATRADDIAPAPLFAKPTVTGHAERKLPEQFVGPIHVHPNGRHVYLANRSDGLVEVRGRKVHGVGENSVAVFSIDQVTGEPTLVQTIDTRSFHCRTFSIDPSGRMLVTAAVAPLDMLQGQDVVTVPAALTIFAIGEDGQLTFAGKQDVDVGSEWMFWCGMVTL